MIGLILSLAAALAVIVGCAHLLTRVDRDQVRRRALLEGAAALRRRAETKWEKNPNAALESNNCAHVLELMAGAEPAVPILELKEQAA